MFSIERLSRVKMNSMLPLVLTCIYVSTVTSYTRQFECGTKLRVPENACCVGGSVRMISNPAGKIVDSENCNPAYDIQDFLLPPEIYYPDALPGDTYLLMLLDIDSPFKLPTDKDRYIAQLIIANIPGEDFTAGNFSNSTVIVPYQNPIPLFNREFHHYQLFVFRYADPRSRTYSPVVPLSFDLPQYLAMLQAEGVTLCGPVSGVQFRCSFLNIAKELENADDPLKS